MKVLLIGTGYMAREYAKVLNGLEVNFDVVGRSKKNSDLFQKDFNVKVVSGGLKSFVMINGLSQYSHVINSSSMESLTSTTICLLKNGSKNLLLEKCLGDLLV